MSILLLQLILVIVVVSRNNNVLGNDTQEVEESNNNNKSNNDNTVWIIDLKDELNKPTQLSIYACQGLYNRNSKANNNNGNGDNDDDGKVVYTLHPDTSRNELDKIWLHDAKNNDDDRIIIYKNITIDDFLDKCLSNDNDIIKGYIRYDFINQLEVVPNIITLAGVLDAIPLQDDYINTHTHLKDKSSSLPLLFDAVIEWKDYNEYDATKDVYEKHSTKTTSMSKMNPGWYIPDENHTPFEPELQKDGSYIELELTDYIIQNRLFNFFLWYGCVDKAPPFTNARKQYNLLNYMATNTSNWDKPIRIYGYDTSWMLFGGYTFEAETNCASSNNMGAVPTRSTNNLSYFTAIHDKITEPISKNPSKDITYNPDHIYLSLIIGDGDNIDYIKSTRRTWMEDRVSRCNVTNIDDNDDKKLCFPLLWSISPHLLYIAPTILKWYHQQMKLTQKDYFVLPPSGDLYSYPTMMTSSKIGEGVQNNFVTNTENDCTILNTNGIVAWEWNGYWKEAVDTYFPKYTNNNIVQALYSENVPYMFPIVRTFPKDETYIQFPNSNLFLFKPREWRGPNTTETSNEFYMSSYDIAQEINNYDNGTVTHIYTTSDGGFSISDIFDMVDYLDDYVHIVDSDHMVSLAFQRNQLLEQQHLQDDDDDEQELLFNDDSVSSGDSHTHADTTSASISSDSNDSNSYFRTTDK